MDAVSWTLSRLRLLRFVCESDLALDGGQILFLELVLVLRFRYGFLSGRNLFPKLFHHVVLALPLLLAQINPPSNVFVVFVSLGHLRLLLLDPELQLVYFVLVDSLLICKLHPLLDFFGGRCPPTPNDVTVDRTHALEFG